MRTSVTGAESALLPFAPTAFLLCRYVGLNSGQSGALVQSDRITEQDGVSRLTAALSTGNPRWSATGEISCPADFATVTNVYAQDGASGGWMVLRADRTGCPSIQNGFVNEHIGDALLRELTLDVGAPGM